MVCEAKGKNVGLLSVVNHLRGWYLDEMTMADVLCSSTCVKNQCNNNSNNNMCTDTTGWFVYLLGILGAASRSRREI